MRQRSLPKSGLVATLLAFWFVVLLCLCGLGAYWWLGDNCEKRGGHMEIVHGSRPGWVCLGAEEGP